MSVTIKNISSGVVVLICSDIKLRKRLEPLRVITLEDKDYDELSFSPGFQTILRQGHLSIINNSDKAEIENDKKSLDLNEIKKIFAEKNITKLVQILPNASDATKESIAKIAIDNDVTDKGFTALINKYCNIDVIKAIAIKHQAEE